MSKNAFVRRRAYTSSALLSVSALAATALISTAGPAGAAITSGGAADAENRPGHFKDAQGIALELCTDAVNCEAADPADPLHGGYFGAEATVGPFLVIYGIETAAGEDEAGNPTAEAIVANVARFRGEGLQPGARYTIKDPWGTTTVFADDRGDVDLVLESGGEAGTVQAGHVQTFLRRVSGAPAGFLGDLETTGPVTGSPTGFNQVRITGPGVNATQRNFAVTGQMLADTAMSSVSTDSLTMGSRRNAAPVVRNIRVSSFGTAPVSASWTKAGANPGAFRVADNCASVASGSACNITVTYTPQPNRSASAILTINDNSLATAPRRVTLNATGPDTLAPKIESASPARGATGIARGRNVSVKFSEAVVGAKKSITLVKSNGRKVAARVSRVGQTDRYVLNPRRALAPRTRYTVKVNGGRLNLRDTVGNVARDGQWRFRTR